MGLFGFGKKEGIHCRDLPDGTRSCEIVRQDKDTLVTSGSKITMAVDPTSCKAMLVGDSVVLEGDEERIKGELKAMEEACKRK